MHDLSMQAQQKLYMHQMFYTELAQYLQRRAALIYQNQTGDGNTPTSSPGDF